MPPRTVAHAIFLARTATGPLHSAAAALPSRSGSAPVGESKPAGGPVPGGVHAMPITVELQPERDRVSVVAWGALTQAERLAALAHCIELLRGHPGAGVLFDARAATTAPSEPETREIMAMAGEAAPVFVAGVAIVILEAVQYGTARMLQALLEPWGVAVSVFTDIDAATAWLGHPPPRSGSA